MRRVAVSIIVLAFAVAGALAQTSASYVVSYVSVEHVYIDAGRADGLAVGDRLGKVVKGETVIALEVVYVALHSASCRTIEGSPAVAAGDALIIVEKSAEIESNVVAPPPAEPMVDLPPMASNAPVSVTPTAPVRLFGNASMVFYHWQDKSEANLDFTQTSARINLRAENIWQEHLNFAIRTRGRYDVRNRAYGVGISETDWENRLWVLSLSYEDADSPFGFAVGRFLQRRLGNIGYIDGGSISARLSKGIQLGVFAGRQPKWAYNNDAPVISKYGGYVAYRNDMKDEWYFDQSLGTIGEFFEGDLNRSFLAWSGSLRRNALWGISHSMELDINRTWRKDKAGESITLSNLLLHSWLRVSRNVRVSLQYDNRQNYWTYQYLSQADSLFDSRVRQGFRGRLDVTPIERTWLSGSVGYRKATGDEDPSISYSGSIRRSRFFGYDLSLSLTISGFDGIYEHGHSYSVRTELPAGALGSPYFSYGGYNYSVDNQEGTRRSNSAEIGTRVDFIQGYYLGGGAEWNSGDDIDGLRFQIELGFRY